VQCCPSCNSRSQGLAAWPSRSATVAAAHDQSVTGFCSSGEDGHCGVCGQDDPPATQIRPPHGRQHWRLVTCSSATHSAWQRAFSTCIASMRCSTSCICCSRPSSFACQQLHDCGRTGQCACRRTCLVSVPTSHAAAEVECDQCAGRRSVLNIAWPLPRSKAWLKKLTERKHWQCNDPNTDKAVACLLSSTIRCLPH